MKTNATGFSKFNAFYTSAPISRIHCFEAPFLGAFFIVIQEDNTKLIPANLRRNKLALVMKKAIVSLCLLLATVISSAQSIVSLQTGKIVELESVQAELTGTFAVAAMERSGNQSKVLLYRSIDNGVSWSLTDSILPHSGEFELPDPVITCYQLGNFYIAFMRVHPSTSDPALTTVDVETFYSTDDGQTWTFASAPHLNDSIADYPQLIAENNGMLHLVYSYITGFPLVNNSKLIHKKSTDGGVTWSSQLIAPNVLSNIGADLAFGLDSTLILTSGNRNDSTVYAFTSNDAGINWTLHHIFPNISGETHHITKPIAHPLVNGYGILSHKAHQENSPIMYHSWYDSTFHSTVIANGAYAQGYMDENGTIYITYNQLQNTNFSIHYIKSTDGGVTFSTPVVLHTALFNNSESGEYQSLLYGQDNLFHLTFCDWGDQSIAKTIVFAPSITSNVAEVTPKENALKVYPNPVAERCTVELPALSTAQQLSLMDINGTVIYSIPVSPSTPTLQLDLSGLENGIYLLRLEETNRYVLSTLVKH